MKTSMMMSSLIFLASCVHIPYKPVYQYKHFSQSCAIRCFDYNNLKITDDVNCGEDFITDLRRPTEDCDGIIGPSIEDYAVYLKPKVIEAIQECKDKN